MKLTKGDKILIVFLSVLSIALAYYFTHSNSNTSGKYVSVMVNGVEVKKIEFSDNVIGETYEIQSEFGRNVIEIGDESVWVIEADCPDKLDIKQGVISRTGEVLVCLPNRMIVEIKSDKPSDEEKIDNYNY